jgi:hypothetical protein
MTAYLEPTSVRLSYLSVSKITRGLTPTHTTARILWYYSILNPYFAIYFLFNTSGDDAAPQEYHLCKQNNRRCVAE